MLNYVNFEEREECVFSMVELFCQKYSDILNFTDSEMDKLQEEFVDYQLLEKRDIPESIWKEALVYEDKEDDIKHYRMDVIWGYIDSSTIQTALQSCQTSVNNSS